MELCHEPDIIAEARTKRLKWAGKITRREEGSMLKEVWRKTPEGRRPQSRPLMIYWHQAKRDLDGSET